MALFNRKILGYTFTTTLAISLFIASGVLALTQTFSWLNILLAVTVASLFSISLTIIIACYRYPIRWWLWLYRSIMRRLAKRAISSSWRFAMTRVKCSGILSIEGGVALEIQAGKDDGIVEGVRFSLHEGTNCEMWGGVIVVDSWNTYSHCVPFDRINVDFWEDLEDRMMKDTSPPSHVYLIRELPSAEITSIVSELLENWR